MDGEGKAHVTDYVLCAYQKIPDSQVRTAFPEEVKTAINLGIKTWFGDWAWPKKCHFGPMVFLTISINFVS